MNFNDLKALLKDELTQRLENEAQKEVSRALSLELKNKWGETAYFRQSVYYRDLLDCYEQFEDLKLNITPADIINILFRIKLFFAVHNESEYLQRVGGGSFMNPASFIIPWSKKTTPYEELVNEYLDKLFKSVQDHTLIVEIVNFRHSKEIYDFFKRLSVLIKQPVRIFLPDGRLKTEHKKLEPHLKKELYTLKEAKRFFCSPSIGFSTHGSENRAFWYGCAWLRAFLHVLRISNFAHPAQMDFGSDSVKYMAPVGPVFLGQHSMGCYSWEEDKKFPWEKIPDGNLLLSFGYRGIANMFLDVRTFPSMEKMFQEGIVIFKHLKNPYSESCKKDIWPTLEILSCAAQATDLGTKILLIYCCLEHLFVPENVRSDNKKYILGGINALNPHMIEWFERLYDSRCQYAHKGFIVKDDKTLGLIFESIKNVYTLLITKLEMNYRLSGH